jgi:hypothetical protein
MPVPLRILATIRDYQQLVLALRDWVAKLGTTGESIDALAGLPDRYVSKLLAPVPLKGIGRHSLGPLLGALGLKLILAVDTEQLALIGHRLDPAKKRRWVDDAREGMRARKQPPGMIVSPAMGRVLNARWQLLMSPKRKREMGRNAARARWGARRPQ